MMQLSIWPVVAIAVATYVYACSVLRFRRVRAMRRKYDFPDRASLSTMTTVQAQEIVSTVAWSEFPFSFETALSVALFRTYAADNVARLLARVSALAKADEAPKRYEDTSVLYSCFAKFAFDTDILHKAVARMNYLHEPYVKSGQILNEDFLYVLWASAGYPVDFINRYEWRPLEDFEVAAIATMWMQIGELMGIDYEAELGKKEWRDGVEFMEDLTEWAKRYEIKYLRPSEDAKHMGAVLLDMALATYPRRLRPLGSQVITLFFGERLRHAFDMPDPTLGVTALTESGMLARKLFLRYLSLPRFSKAEVLSQPDADTGRIKHYTYLSEPWYRPATFAARWGPPALMKRLAGGTLPGQQEAKFRPEGFLFEDLGPVGRSGKSSTEGRDFVEKVAASAAAGCPFATVKT